MEREVLLRKVSLLQACVRGFLVRRQFQRLRAEYETIVGEIEGDLGPLQWTEGRMPRPKFLPQVEATPGGDGKGGKDPTKGQGDVHGLIIRSLPAGKRWVLEGPQLPLLTPQPLLLSAKCLLGAQTHDRLAGGSRTPVISQKAKPHGNRGAEGRTASAKPAPWRAERKANWVEEQGEAGERSVTPPDRDDSSWPQAEASRKPKGRQTRGTLREKTPEAIGPGTPHGSPEFQELQCHRSHLAMELLWIQQAINSRKEYLILKQTLSSPEVDRTREQTRTRPNPGGQACGLMPSQPPEEQSCRVRIPREPSHVDDTCQRGGRSQGRRSSERPVPTDQNSAEAESRAPCCMSAGPHSPARGHRLTKDPSQGGQALEGGSLQQGQILEEQTTGVLKPRGTCSRKARIQLRELFEDPDMKDKCLQWLDPQDSDCQTSKHQPLGLSEDPILWERTPAGPEHGRMDVRRAKPAKSQTPRNGASTDPDGQGYSSQRTGLWCSRLPETLSPAGSSHTGENQWRDGQWKTGPAG